MAHWTQMSDRCPLGYLLLILGIHAKTVLWDITNCARVNATSESSDQGHSEVKGQICAF